jgi:NAD(P)-dependent dehydrogenase (short-subunit alcohol dehydrogenase family)
MSDRVALVTGAASGIGQAVGERLRGDGWDVFTVDVRGDVDHSADLTTRAGNRESVAAAVETFGRLDAVVPNAGFQHVAPVEEFPESSVAVQLTVVGQLNAALLYLTEFPRIKIYTKTAIRLYHMPKKESMYVTLFHTRAEQQ